jgi:EmrB/QacA subfamily drug resistance transporter
LERSSADLKKQQVFVFLIFFLVLLQAAINSTIVATALPDIQRDLGIDLNWTGWVITGYMLMSVTVMPLLGRISDEWGRKRVFLFCLALFLLSSWLCAVSPNIYWLIACRFLQAAGGGGLGPSIYGLAGDYFPEERARVIGMFTSIYSLGCIIGPAIGGWLLVSWSWRSVFWFNLPIGLLALVAAGILLEKDQVFKRTRQDLPGAVLFSGFLFVIIYFMTRLGQDPSGLYNWKNWLLPALAVVFLAAFLRRESRETNPIIEMSLLKSRIFAVMNILNLVYGACFFGISTFIPYFAQAAYGFSSLASGTLLTGQALGMMGMAFVTSMLLKRTGYRIPMALGFLLLSLSTLGLAWYLRHTALFGWEIPSYGFLMSMSFVSGIGSGLTSPSSNNAAIELMPEKISAISGLRGMFRMAGGIMGVAGVVLTLSRFIDPAAGFRVVFLGLGLLLLVSLPLIREVPEPKPH